MADGDTDTLELTEDLIVQSDDVDSTKVDTQEDVDQIDGEVGDIGFDDDAAPASEDSDLVKHLRKIHREQAAEIRRLNQFVPKRPELPEKPDLYGTCEGDPERFEREILSWNDAVKKRKHEDDEQERKEQELQQQYDAELELVTNAADRLKLANYDEARETVEMALTDHQFMTLVRASSDPGKLIYALGKSPERLEKLSHQKDLIKLAGDVARMESSIRARPKPVIDKPTTGGAPAQVSTDKHLDAILKKAEQSGNYTEYFKAKRASNK